MNKLFMIFIYVLYLKHIDCVKHDKYLHLNVSAKLYSVPKKDD